MNTKRNRMVENMWDIIFLALMLIIAIIYIVGRWAWDFWTELAKESEEQDEKWGFHQ